VSAGDDAGDVLFGDGSDEAEMRELLQNDEDGVGAGADERAGVDEAVGDHAIEGGGDAEVTLEVLLSSDSGFGGAPGLLAGADEGLGGFDLLADDFDLVTGDGAGGFGGFLESLEGGLEYSYLSFGLEPVGFGDLDFGFGFGDAGFDFGGTELDEKVALVDGAAAVDGDLLDVAGDLGVKGDGEEGLEFAREVDGAGDGFGDDGGELLGGGGGEEDDCNEQQLRGYGGREYGVREYGVREYGVRANRGQTAASTRRVDICDP
jgi:hypothetical protein